MKYLYRIITFDNNYKKLNLYLGPFDTQMTFEALSFIVHKYIDVLPELTIEDIHLSDNPSLQGMSSGEMVSVYSNYLFNKNDFVKFSDSTSIWKIIDQNRNYNTNTYILKNINNETYTSAAEYELELV